MTLLYKGNLYTIEEINHVVVSPILENDVVTEEFVFNKDADPVHYLILKCGKRIARVYRQQKVFRRTNSRQTTFNF